MNVNGTWVRALASFVAAMRAMGRASRGPRWVVPVCVLGLTATVATGAGAGDARPWGTVRAVTGTHLLVVSPDLGNIPVRLVGIDLPEPPRTASGVAVEGQPFGQQSADYVRDLLLAKQVQLDTYGKDREGRQLSVVWLGDINVNLTLVKEGLAWVDPTVKLANVRAGLEVAERQARVGKYGLWALPDPEPPWEYRKRYKLTSR